MQGDIFQLEQMAAHATATQFEPSHMPLDSQTNPTVAIYNEDDLSHLLYANHMHHNGHKDKVIVNHVYRDGYSTPLESGTQTPLSESNETPVLSDCESDFDEGVYSPNPYSRINPLRFEDGFDFPVFLGRQTDRSDSSESHATSQPSLEQSHPVPELKSALKSQDKHVQTAASESTHVADISGPLMSWWPAPTELMEHEWVEEKPVESTKVMLANKHVSSIEGGLMSWWPSPLEIMDYEWSERFYE
ncbi:hypothetical protein GGS26DRAFT_544339 [Hypomontagnella submonticulosa]|nr:hypothetical protein GGS26DRAFT_544339 [Hypomontagnella submonticulosa]